MNHIFHLRRDEWLKRLHLRIQVLGAFPHRSLHRLGHLAIIIHATHFIICLHLGLLGLPPHVRFTIPLLLKNILRAPVIQLLCARLELFIKNARLTLRQRVIIRPQHRFTINHNHTRLRLTPRSSRTHSLRENIRGNLVVAGIARALARLVALSLRLLCRHRRRRHRVRGRRHHRPHVLALARDAPIVRVHGVSPSPMNGVSSQTRFKPSTPRRTVGSVRVHEMPSRATIRGCRQ
mmetsp:Transcript_5213/g.18967  ORF Transcript_5213/g.18967 Transcript_5213/m.18967 type:complete len:235 (+) Transcript_5213:6095-6799(+)